MLKYFFTEHLLTLLLPTVFRQESKLLVRDVIFGG